MTQYGSMRVGTQEREEADRLLGEHLSMGRLEAGEHGERVALAMAATTYDDIAALFADLPEPRPGFMRPPTPAPAATPTAPGGYRAAGLGGYGAAGLVPLSEKSKVVAGVLNIVLPFGIGRFYSGQTGLALAQLLVTVFTAGVGAVWPFVDGILLLVNGGYDGQGRRLHD